MGYTYLESRTLENDTLAGCAIIANIGLDELFGGVIAIPLTHVERELPVALLHHLEEVKARVLETMLVGNVPEGKTHAEDSAGSLQQKQGDVQTIQHKEKFHKTCSVGKGRKRMGDDI